MRAALQLWKNFNKKVNINYDTNMSARVFIVGAKREIGYSADEDFNDHVIIKVTVYVVSSLIEML